MNKHSFDIEKSRCRNQSTTLRRVRTSLCSAYTCIMHEIPVLVRSDGQDFCSFIDPSLHISRQQRNREGLGFAAIPDDLGFEVCPGTPIIRRRPSIGRCSRGSGSLSVCRHSWYASSDTNDLRYEHHDCDRVPTAKVALSARGNSS